MYDLLLVPDVGVGIPELEYDAIVIDFDCLIGIWGWMIVLFMTWYGNFSVWCGIDVFFHPVRTRDREIESRPKGPNGIL